MENAIVAVTSKALNCKDAAKLYGVPHSTLFQRIKKLEESDGSGGKFLCEMSELFSHIIRASRLNYSKSRLDQSGILELIF